MQTAPDARTRSTSMQKRVLVGASVGQFVEFYDFAIYGFSAVAIAKAFFPSANGATGLLSAFAVYGVAFVVRPLGGLFFGALGDRIGRRAVLYTTLLAMGMATTAIGLVPTHASIGISAPVLLVVCRLVQGFSAGGEAVGAPSFVLEHAPHRRRGTWIAVAIAMSAATSVVALIFILGVTSGLSDAAFQSWGWRIAFLVALPLSLVGLYIRHRTEESPVFQELQRADALAPSPIRQTLSNDTRRLVQIFFIMALSGLGFYVLVGYFVTYLETVVGLSRVQSLSANAVGLLGFSLMLPLNGRLSDRFGRKPMLVVGAAAVAVLSLPAFMLVTSGSFFFAILGELILCAALCIYGGGSYTYFVELLPPATRLTGAAISYNLAFALFGGTAPFFGTYLVDVTGSPLAVGFYLVAVAVVALFVAATAPESSILKSERSAVADGRFMG